MLQYILYIFTETKVAACALCVFTSLKLLNTTLLLSTKSSSCNIAIGSRHDLDTCSAAKASNRVTTTNRVTTIIITLGGDQP